MTKFEKGFTPWNKGKEMSVEFKQKMIGNKNGLGAKHSEESIRIVSEKRTKHPVIDGKKECADCGITKDITEFHKNKTRKDGISTLCKLCSTERHQKYYYENREVLLAKIKEHSSKPHAIANKRNSNLKINYGITEEDYQEMLVEQNNSCAICGVNQNDLRYKLYVDHDHKTGEVRGLLCKHCNSAIGLFNDNKSLLLKAIDYLRGK